MAFESEFPEQDALGNIHFGNETNQSRTLRIEGKFGRSRSGIGSAKSSVPRRPQHPDGMTPESGRPGSCSQGLEPRNKAGGRESEPNNCIWIDAHGDGEFMDPRRDVDLEIPQGVGGALAGKLLNYLPIQQHTVGGHSAPGQGKTARTSEPGENLSCGRLILRGIQHAVPGAGGAHITNHIPIQRSFRHCACGAHAVQEKPPGRRQPHPVQPPGKLSETKAESSGEWLPITYLQRRSGTGRPGSLEHPVHGNGNIRGCVIEEQIAGPRDIQFHNCGLLRGGGQSIKRIGAGDRPAGTTQIRITQPLNTGTCRHRSFGWSGRGRAQTGDSYLIQLTKPAGKTGPFHQGSAVTGGDIQIEFPPSGVGPDRSHRHSIHLKDTCGRTQRGLRSGPTKRKRGPTGHRKRQASGHGTRAYLQSIPTLIAGPGWQLVHETLGRWLAFHGKLQRLLQLTHTFICERFHADRIQKRTASGSQTLLLPTDLVVAGTHSNEMPAPLVARFQTGPVTEPDSRHRQVAEGVGIHKTGKMNPGGAQYSRFHPRPDGIIATAKDIAAPAKRGGFPGPCARGAGRKYQTRGIHRFGTVRHRPGLPGQPINPCPALTAAGSPADIGSGSNTQHRETPISVGIRGGRLRSGAGKSTALGASPPPGQRTGTR